MNEHSNYPIDEKTMTRIENDYVYHPPTPEQVIRYQEIREKFKDIAFYLCSTCPPSRELSVALTQDE